MFNRHVVVVEDEALLRDLIAKTLESSGFEVTTAANAADAARAFRQGNDRGTQYRSGIYVTSPAQAEVAKALIAEIEAENVFDTAVVTEVLPLQNYSAAEEYHQDFFERNPTQGYCLAVAAPKVWKFKKTFSDWVKPK